jgi:hypothetical protein
MNPITARQARYNLMTRDSWDRFAPPRPVVTRLLVEAAPPGRPRLCVLGAGNGNDLDLRQLTGVYGEIHLVDLDAAALRAGVTRQLPPATPTVFLHGDIDLSGVVELLGPWTVQAPPTHAEFQECLTRAARAQLAGLPVPFEVVCSACVLTQLIDAVHVSLDPQHPRFFELVFAVRDRHLRLLLELLAPGGWGVLVTDFVSSVTCPSLGQIPEAQLPRAVARLINERNFFTGANPAALASLFQGHPDLAPRVARVEVTAPWRWQLDERVYAVCAVRIQKKEDAHESSRSSPWASPTC